mgnify:FL=1
MSVRASLETVIRHPVAGSFRHGAISQSRWQVLVGGVAGALLLSVAASASPVPPASVVVNHPVDATSTAQPIADGVYFYGSQPQPDAIGAAYMVFEAQNSNVVGALYMPQSSFDCFEGHLTGQALALQITNSYTQEVYAYAIALVTDDSPVAATNPGLAPLQLDGFFDLGTPRAAENNILTTCQSHLLPGEMEL